MNHQSLFLTKDTNDTFFVIRNDQPVKQQEN